MSKIPIQINSRDNQKLKNVRKIRDGKLEDFIFIEGTRVCEEALRSNLRIRQCFCELEFAQTERGQILIDQLPENCELYELSNSIFQTIADTKSSQGIILIAEKPRGDLEKMEFKDENRKNKLFVFLFEINNPSNLGAILRTAEAAGVSGVIISRNSADLFSQKSIRAALGANFRLPFWTNAEFDEVIEWAAKNNFKTTAADVRAARKYTEIDWNESKLLIFGSEAEGLSAENLGKIAEKIYIPMENEVESLNLAVSCAVILFEWKRNK